MSSLFAVFITGGAAWRQGLPLEQQEVWQAHADFMNALLAEGFVALGGPLHAEDAHDVLLIIRANSEQKIRERLAADPWHRMDLLRIARIVPWTLRLGELP